MDQYQVEVQKDSVEQFDNRKLSKNMRDNIRSTISPSDHSGYGKDKSSSPVRSYSNNNSPGPPYEANNMPMQSHDLYPVHVHSATEPESRHFRSYTQED